jgi:hypothetical protein
VPVGGKRGGGAHLDLASHLGELARLRATTTRPSPAATVAGKRRGEAPARAEPDDDEAEGDGAAPFSSPAPLRCRFTSAGCGGPLFLPQSSARSEIRHGLRVAGDPPWPPRHRRSAEGEQRRREGSFGVRRGERGRIGAPPPPVALRRHKGGRGMR